MKTNNEIAERIKNSQEWNLEDCRALCEEADILEEWEKADGENFESVVEKAADILGVKIY
jgi:hypothetical protein